MLIANQQEIDLGTLQFGKPYMFKYIITNTDSRTIDVKKLIMGCHSCTKASLDEHTLKPGTSSVINVTFTPGSTGIQNKSISVQYTTSGENVMHSVVLKFKGNVSK